MKALRTIVPLTLCLALLGGCAGSGLRGSTPLGDEVWQAIKLEGSINTTRVNVSELGGVVTLSGFVNSLNDELLLTETAQSVEGVRRVRTNLTVLDD